MKRVCYLILILLHSAWSGAEHQEVGIGNEHIEPFKYPKFSVSGEYSLARRLKALGQADASQVLLNQFAYALSFEAALYEHFNAGGIFSANIPPKKGDPSHIRLGLFAKPFFAITERLSIFTRLSAGFGGVIAGDAIGAAAHGMATLGVEYFPFSRLGIGLEYGLRGEITRLKSLVADKASPISYIFYETPALLTLHIII